MHFYYFHYFYCCFRWRFSRFISTRRFTWRLYLFSNDLAPPFGDLYRPGSVRSQFNLTNSLLCRKTLAVLWNLHQTVLYFVFSWIAKVSMLSLNWWLTHMSHISTLISVNMSTCWCKQLVPAPLCPSEMNSDEEPPAISAGKNRRREMFMQR